MENKRSQPNMVTKDKKNEEFISKVSVVRVDKKSRGRFPGDQAPVGIVGLVWSSWRGGTYGTHKVSLVTKDLKLYFTTASCASIIGKSSEINDFTDVRERWADKNFIPIILEVEDVRLSGASLKDKSLMKIVEIAKDDGMWGRDKVDYIKCKSLTQQRLWVRESCCHPKDWKNMLKNILDGKKVFCVRLEPWVLEKVDII